MRQGVEVVEVGMEDNDYVVDDNERVDNMVVLTIVSLKYTVPVEYST